MDSKENQLDQKAEQVAKEFNVNLPLGNAPLIIKIIALFTLLGGLSVMGSIFGDLVRPGHNNLGLYLLRIITGVLAIVVSYGILHQKKWSIWLYGLIVVIGFLNNPLFAILPAIIVVYLYLKKDYFKS